MIKKILVFLFLTILQINPSSAVELVITNDISDILNSQKICVRLNLEGKDQAIHSNSLDFSIDNPYINIITWKCKQNHTLQYLPRFKRVKKLYTQSLSGEIALNLEQNDKKKALKNLSESNLYVSCIILDKNGTSQPVSLVKALDDSFSFIDTETYNNHFDNTLNYDNITTFTQNYLKNNIVKRERENKKINIPKKPVPEYVNVIIDNLKVIWKTLTIQCKFILKSLNNIILYLIIFILIILLSFKQIRSKNPFLIELHRFLVISCILWSYSFLNVFIPQYIFFSIFAILMTPISMYYIFTAQTESILDKLKSFIGIALAISILPILLKAYLSFIKF